MTWILQPHIVGLACGIRYFVLSQVVAFTPSSPSSTSQTPSCTCHAPSNLENRQYVSSAGYPLSTPPQLPSPHRPIESEATPSAPASAPSRTLSPLLFPPTRYSSSSPTTPTEACRARGSLRQYSAVSCLQFSFLLVQTSNAHSRLVNLRKAAPQTRCPCSNS